MPAEGSPDDGTFTITAVRSATSGTSTNQEGFAVSYKITGSARNGQDYLTLGAIEFPTGGNSVSLVITPNDDVLAEGDETVTVTLADGPGYMIDPLAGAATLTLLDDEPLLSITGTTNGQEGVSSAVYTVSYSGTLKGTVTVSYEIATTSVAKELDVTVSGTVNINAGERTALITVPVLDDAILEGNETLTLSLKTSADYRINESGASASVTILDNEPTVSITASVPDAAEGGATGVFLISLSAAQAAPITVSYVVTGTASSGNDFGSLGSSIIFTPGVLSRTLSVVPTDDSSVENLETVRITLTSSTAYAIAGTGVAQVAIADNDTSSGDSGGGGTPTPNPDSLADSGSGDSGGCGAGGGLGLLLAGFAMVALRRRRRD